jgi:enoyl-[acyl-carrier protein] reductase I
MGFLQDKRALIVGLASSRSIAWGIAEVMRRQGAELAFTYQNDKVRERVETLAAECGSSIILPCDVSSDPQIEQVFERLDDYWSHLDIIVHSVAFAPRTELQGHFVDSVTREGFRVAHEISSYSFAALAKAGRSMMKGRRGALLTLSYLGAEKAVPHYNVMGLAKASLEANVRYLAQSLGAEGIRVNAISAGPLKTLAAAGITDFRKLLDYVGRGAPLHRNVTLEEVGNAAAFLCSDLASGITGEVVHVDCGFNIVALGVA